MGDKSALESYMTLSKTLQVRNKALERQVENFKGRNSELEVDIGRLKQRIDNLKNLLDGVPQE